MSRPSRAARPCCYWLGEEEEGIPWREGVRQSSKLLRGRSRSHVRSWPWLCEGPNAKCSQVR